MVALNLDYWNSRFNKPFEYDLAAINDAFKEYPKDRRDLTEDEKLVLAELLLQSCMRFATDERGDLINRTVAKFERFFAGESLFYAAEGQMYYVWRYSYRDFVQSIPKTWAKKAIQSIYHRLGVEIDDEETEAIYASDFIYGAYFELIKSTLKDRSYIKANCEINYRVFSQVCFFNMWHLFGKLGFEGLSPYQIMADIGEVTPPASQWSFPYLSAAQRTALEEIKRCCRKRVYPTSRETIFLMSLTDE